MKRNKIDLCDWLGTASVGEFKSREQIREYFTEDNLRKMFGADANMDQREQAMQQCIEEWADGNQKSSMGELQRCRDCEGTGYFFTLTQDELPSMVELQCERCNGTGSEPHPKGE